MLPIISYLNNLQITGKKCDSLPSKEKVNLDDQLLKLRNHSRDTHPTHIRYNDGPPFVCKFRKDNELDLLAVANENGEILMVDTDNSKVLRTFIAHRNAIFDICWLPDKNFLMTASGDHTAKLFDMTTCQNVSHFPGDFGSIKSIDVCHTDSNIFATGTRNGFIGIWDRRERHSVTKRPCSVIADAHVRRNPVPVKGSFKQNLSSVSAVAFQDANRLVSAGVADGVIKVWDLRRTFIKTRTNYTPWHKIEYSDPRFGEGCSSLKFDSTHTKLYAYLTSNALNRYDFLSYTDDYAVYTGTRSKSYFVGMDLSYDDQYILGGSKDGRAYIWNVSKPGAPILALPGAKNDEVGSVAWCPYSLSKLITAGDDCKVRIWRVHTVWKDDHYDFEATNENLIGTGTPSMATKSLLTQPTLTTLLRTWQTPETPAMKSITNFYSPVTPYTPLQSSTTANSNPDSGDIAGPETGITSPKSDLASPQSDTTSPGTDPARSPCNTVTDNECVAGFSGVVLKTSPQKGKENNSTHCLKDTPKHSDRIIGQVKRKLCLKRTTCKYHPDGCGRTKGHTRCGKRIVFYPPPVDQPSIKNFLTPP